MYTRTLASLFLTGSLASAQSPLAHVPSPVTGATPRPHSLSSLFWGDYDRDGLSDAWVVQPDGSGRLLHNEGDGTFEDVTQRSGLSGLKGAHMAIWADANSDGRLDLYLPAYRGTSLLLLQSEARTFEDATDASGLPRHAEPLDALWFDYDGDRRPDLWLTTLYDDLVYHNEGNGRFEKVDLGLVPRVAPLENEPPLDVNRARQMRGLDPIEGDTTITSSSNGPGGPGAPGLNADLICAIAVQDISSPTNCLPASSDPLLGHLYPISSDWFVESGTGNVGIGTTSPVARLDVVGDVRADGQLVSTATTGAPLSVASSEVVPGLNADLLDGLDSSAFSQLGSSIGNAELEPDSVRSPQILDGSITAADLADDSVGSDEIADNAVVSGKIAASSVTGAEIASDAITDAHLASGSVGSDEIVDGSLTADDLATDSVGAAELAPNSVLGFHILDSQITAADLAVNSVGTSELAPGSVIGGIIMDGTITSVDLATGAVGTAEIADGSIMAADLAAGAVGTAQLALESVTTGQIAPDTILSTDIATGAIHNLELAPDCVTSSKIDDGTIMGVDIATGAVGPNHIGQNAIGSFHIADGSLSDSDIAGNAAVAGTKIVPDFGSQDVVTTGAGEFENTLFNGFAVAGRRPGGASGYHGVSGTTDFDGVPSADWFGNQIGAAGISVSDPQYGIGVLGHGYATGVRAENSADPSTFAELATILGVGVSAQGSTRAGQFVGRVLVTHAGSDEALNVHRSQGGPAMLVEASSATNSSTALTVDHAGTGRAAHFSQANGSLFPTVQVDSSATSNAHTAMSVVESASGSAARFLCDNTAASGDGVDVRVLGSGDALVSRAEGGGYAGFFEANHPSGVALWANNRLDTGNIIEASNGNTFNYDIEFRVDSSGQVYCDGSFNGGGADYAEWLERKSANEAFEAGDVVGVDAGVISKDLAGAEQIMVISSNPVLVGNNADAEEDDREGFEMVAFLGQVSVKVRGPVTQGDLIVPSGRDDGTAVAVSPRQISAGDLARVIGTSWESAADEGIHLVNCAIGIDQSKACALVIGRLRADAQVRDREVAALEARLAALEAIVAEVLERK